MAPAERDRAYARGPFEPGTLLIDRSSVTLARDGAPHRTVDRRQISRGWFVPPFTERALGLALAGEERPVVVTAAFGGWLVLELRSGSWLCASTDDRDLAYRALDALGMGPAQTTARWSVFAQTASRASMLRPRTREQFARASQGALASVVVLDATLAYLQALGSLSVVTASAVVAAALARRAYLRRIARWTIDPAARRVTIEQTGVSPQRFDLRKFERVRLTRTGFVLEYEDAPRPVAVEIVSPSDAARAIEGEHDAIARLRVAHTFIDWAQRARDSVR